MSWLSLLVFNPSYVGTCRTLKRWKFTTQGPRGDHLLMNYIYLLFILFQFFLIAPSLLFCFFVFFLFCFFASLLFCFSDCLLSNFKQFCFPPYSHFCVACVSGFWPFLLLRPSHFLAVCFLQLFCSFASLFFLLSAFWLLRFSVSFFCSCLLFCASLKVQLHLNATRTQERQE